MAGGGPYRAARLSQPTPNAPAIRTSAGEHMSCAELWQAPEAIAACLDMNSVNTIIDRVAERL